MGQPNKLGHFLAGYMMIPFGFFLTKTSRYWIMAGPAILISILGLLGAVSRGAILAAGVSILLVGLVRKSPWVVVAALLIGTSPHWLPDKVMDRFDDTVSMTSDTGVEIDTTSEGRTEIWAAGMNMIADNPFGVGLGQFQYNLPRYGYQGRHLRNAHNILIQLAAEEGILAALAHLFITVYLGATAYALSRSARNDFERAFAVAVLGVVISFGCSTMFANGFYENILSGPYWILAGMTINLKIRSDAERSGELQAEEQPREE
jgi:O-antigen ligase